MTSLPLRLAPLLVVLAVPMVVHGQEDGAAKTAVTISPAGMRRYEPGAWSTLAINATNDTDSDTDEFISVYIGKGNSHLQFARRFWLPAGTRRKTHVPILIPAILAGTPRQENELAQADAFYMRLKDRGDAETFEGHPRDTNIQNQPLQLEFEQNQAAFLFHRTMPDEVGGPDVDQYAYEAAYKSREAALGSRILIEFSGDFIPPFPTTLDSLDQMVISGDQILNDSVGLANLRHWLHRGGRIWIMLDTTSMETVAALLGNEARCSIVDRVELNAFELEDLSGVRRLLDEPTVESWSSEIPVEMVRVFAGTDDIHCRIDGWPAAFWQQVGDGEVLFTTLGPRGWVESGDPKPSLASIARRFYQPREATNLDPEMFEPLLKDQIGYRIPSRRLATWVLGLNSLAILSFGCWCARKRQLEQLAWFVPVVALVASAVFLFIGSRNTVAVPSTVAIAQVVRVSNATHEADVSAVTGVFSQESIDRNVVAKNGTLATVDDMATRGVIKRIVWDDNGQSRWVNLQQPSGVVRNVESRRTIPLGVPIVAHGTFDDSGFRGALTGIDESNCEDAVIAIAPAKAAAVSLDSAGGFHVGLEDVLATGQYIADGLLSEKQRSRQELLRRLLASTEVSPFGSEPSLLVWTPLLDGGVEFNPGFEQVGSALTSIPLQIERPATGVEVRIPATFIKIKSFTGRQGASSFFNQRTGLWFPDATKPTRSQLHCAIPKALLPLQLNQATVTIKITAPSRTLKIEGLVDGTLTVLHEKSNPNGVLRFDIDRPEALELDADGGLHLTIVVTRTVSELEVRDGPADPDDVKIENNTWQIDYVHVDAKGTVR